MLSGLQLKIRTFLLSVYWLIGPLLLKGGETEVSRFIWKDQLTRNAAFTLIDYQADDEAEMSPTEYLVNRYVKVRLFYAEEILPSTSLQWFYSIKYNILVDDNAVSEGNILTIQNHGINEINENYKIHSIDEHEIELQIKSISFVDAEGENLKKKHIPDDIGLELTIGSRIYKVLSKGDTPENVRYVSRDKTLYWDYVDGAEEYDVEWVFINAYEEDINGDPADFTPEEAFAQKDPVRVTVNENKYKCFLVYPKGRLYYRVRPVGRYIRGFDDYKTSVYGAWSYMEGEYYEVRSANESNKNWQYVASYAEEGKQKAVITYMDGSYRSRQQLTNLSSEDLTLVAETRYDYQGRASVTLLPSPLKGSSFSYRRGLNFTEDNEPFDKPHYCSAEPEQLRNTSGVSGYYSENNRFTSKYAGYVPDANGYVYSQVEYMPDNTGRVLRQGGVGEKYVLGSGHETQYIYSTPTRVELQSLFGSNVGEARHYKKNVVIDPNGQASLSYLDNQGRTVATALTGETPTPLIDYREVTNGEENKIDLHGANVIDRENLISRSVNTVNYTPPLLLEGGTVYTFKYDFEDKTGNTALLYDLELSMIGPDFQPVTLIEYSMDVEGEETEKPRAEGDDPHKIVKTKLTKLDEITFKATFDKAGAYRLTKRLKLNIDEARKEIERIVNDDDEFTEAKLQGEIDLARDIDESLYAIGTEDESYDNCYGLEQLLKIDVSPGGFHYEEDFYGTFWSEVRSDYLSNPAKYEGASSYYELQDPEKWNPAWADKMFVFHREYCHWLACNTYKTSAEFDVEMQSFKTYEEEEDPCLPGWTDAYDNGYLNPQGMTITYDDGSSATNKLDPYQSSDLEVVMLDCMGSGKDIWTYIIDYYNPDYTAGRSGPDGKEELDYIRAISEADRDIKKWELFCKLYGEMKQEIWSGGCTFYDDDNAHITKMPENEEEAELFIEEAEREYESGCEDLCEQNINQWMAGVADNCGFNWDDYPSEKRSVYNIMYDNCTDNCDLDNPMGIIKRQDIVDWGITLPVTCTDDKVKEDICRKNAARWVRELSTYCDDLDLITLEQQLYDLCAIKQSEDNPSGVVTNDDLIDHGITINCPDQVVFDEDPYDYYIKYYREWTYEKGNNLRNEIDFIDKNFAEWLEEFNDNITEEHRSHLLNDFWYTDFTYDVSTLYDDYEVYKNNPDLFFRRAITMAYTPFSHKRLVLTMRVCSIDDEDCGTQCKEGSEYLDHFLFTIRIHEDILFDDIESFVGPYNINYPTLNVFWIEIKLKDGSTIYGEVIYKHEYLDDLLFIELPARNYRVPIYKVSENPIEFSFNIDASEKERTDNAKDQATDLVKQTWTKKKEEKQTTVTQQVYKKAFSLDPSKFMENMSYEAEPAEYHYTLYYYDQAGNLVKTIPPAGFDEGFRQAEIGGNNPDDEPSHKMPTTYKYNTLNQLIAQYMPDHDVFDATSTNPLQANYSTLFYYDRAGRLIASQNARQYHEAADNEYLYSYTLYDGQSRIIEVGQLSTTEPISDYTFSDQNHIIDYNTFANWVNTGIKEEVTFTRYDSPIDEYIKSIFKSGGQENLRSRVASVSYEEFDDGDMTTYDHATHYSYDAHGNVKYLIQENTHSQLTDHQYKHIEYEYDLMSGNVNKVIYQRDEPDQFMHKYEYDSDNRITHVYTSTDGMVWDNDARYLYYPHGPLARAELGHEKVQGIDYAYTLQGWLKGVNSATLNTAHDMGKDGNFDYAEDNNNSYIAGDAFGFTLGYHENDYEAARGTPHFYDGYNDIYDKSGSLYNGNITNMITTIPVKDNATGNLVASPMASVYKYDQLHRIKNRYVYDGSSDLGLDNLYNTEYTYDPNGNIDKLIRKGSGLDADGTTPISKDMDELTYYYKSEESNQLVHIEDDVADNNYTTDIDDQGDYSINPEDWNYKYDAIGNLIQDKQADIEYDDTKGGIFWNVAGKVKRVERKSGSDKPDIDFYYDGTGNRVMKIVTKSDGTEKITYHVRDAQGNIMATYTNNQDEATVAIEENAIYGSSRLGIMTRSTEETTVTNEYTRTSGSKKYELTNHLGNVLAIISDKREAVDSDVDGIVDYYKATVLSSNDYYPFGMQMPGRKMEGPDYRFGFNGKEKDDEWQGSSGAIYDYGFRIYDSRIAKFLSVDPLTKSYPMLTPYQFASNTPIQAIDLDGLEAIHYYYDLNISSEPLFTLVDHDQLKRTVTAHYRQKNGDWNSYDIYSWYDPTQLIKKAFSWLIEPKGLIIYGEDGKGRNIGPKAKDKFISGSFDFGAFKKEMDLVIKSVSHMDEDELSSGDRKKKFFEGLIKSLDLKVTDKDIPKKQSDVEEYNRNMRESHKVGDTVKIIWKNTSIPDKPFYEEKDTKLGDPKKGEDLYIPID